jgi:hypothetical protein
VVQQPEIQTRRLKPLFALQLKSCSFPLKAIASPQATPFMVWCNPESKPAIRKPNFALDLLFETTP